MHPRARIIGLITLLLMIPMTVAADYYGKQKVVYHINSGEERLLRMALVNIQNHLAAVGTENIDVVVVLHSDGVELLRIAKKDEDLQKKISALKAEHVVIKVCANTLKSKNLDYRKDLFGVDAGDLVPSGVAELVRLQQQGYQYVKP
jgi:intracellular sulfur oxidation DsrE/DsrF family protein